MEKIALNAYTHVYKIAKSEVERVDFASCKEPKETLSSFYARQSEKPKIVINGGLFVMSSGKPIANYRDERVDKAVSSSYIYGMGINDAGEMVTSSVKTPYKDFISGYPCLVSNGAADKITYATELDGRNPRTAIGYDADHYYIMIVDGRTSKNLGATFSQMQQWFISLGAEFAINLDGGGSTRILVDGQVDNEPTENRAVDNVVCFYFKESASEGGSGSGSGESGESGSSGSIKVKCKSKTSTYTASGVVESRRYVAAGDICELGREVSDNLLIPISYPTSSGERRAYIKDLGNFMKA